jgi:hypothetical protein
VIEEWHQECERLTALVLRLAHVIPSGAGGSNPHEGRPWESTRTLLTSLTQALATAVDAERQRLLAEAASLPRH